MPRARDVADTKRDRARARLPVRYVLAVPALQTRAQVVGVEPEDLTDGDERERRGLLVRREPLVGLTEEASLASVPQPGAELVDVDSVLENGEHEPSLGKDRVPVATQIVELRRQE